MSTFLGPIEEIPGISVDRFDGENLESSAYFLSHCHTDHMRGLNFDFFKHLQQHKKYLYCSSISKAFLEARYHKQVYVKDLAIDRKVLIEYEDKNRDDCNDAVFVTCISAGHCPGSVMFLFKKTDKLILYTGDFRINPLDYRKIKPLNIRRNSDIMPRKLVKVYLDTTFLDPGFMYMPTRKESMNEICRVIKEWLEKNPRNFVVLECSALYGSEFLYMQLSQSLNMRIHVKDVVHNSYCRIPDLACCITSDPLSTRVHACTNKNDRSGPRCRRDVFYENVLTIVPSVLRWKGKETRIVGEWDNNRERTFNVCYSTHASFDELRKFIQYFKPEEIFPCVCPEDSKENVYLHLNTIMSSTKKRKTDIVEDHEDYTLRALKYENIDKPWAKYYFAEQR